MWLWPVATTMWRRTHGPSRGADGPAWGAVDPSHVPIPVDVDAMGGRGSLRDSGRRHPGRPRPNSRGIGIPGRPESRRGVQVEALVVVAGTRPRRRRARARWARGRVRQRPSAGKAALPAPPRSRAHVGFLTQHEALPSELAARSQWRVASDSVEHGIRRIGNMDHVEALDAGARGQDAHQQGRPVCRGLSLAHPDDPDATSREADTDNDWKGATTANRSGQQISRIDQTVDGRCRLVRASALAPNAPGNRPRRPTAACSRARCWAGRGR